MPFTASHTREFQHTPRKEISKMITCIHAAIYNTSENSAEMAGYTMKICERGFGKNTGMGLFPVKEIPDITGIIIRGNGEPGKGARFKIAVPEDMVRSKETDSSRYQEYISLLEIFF